MIFSDRLTFQGYFVISCITNLSGMHVSYRMYTLCITLCITVDCNAFPQLQRNISHLVLRAVFADFINLIDVFSDAFWRGTVSYHRKTSP